MTPRASSLERSRSCPDPSCSTTYLTSWGIQNHYLAIHTGARWPCVYAEQSGCDRTSSSIYNAKQHAEDHFPRSRWICQYHRCLAHMQGRRQSKYGTVTHYNMHIQRGHFKDGEYKPFKVRDGTNKWASSNGDNRSGRQKKDTWKLQSCCWKGLTSKAKLLVAVFDHQFYLFIHIFRLTISINEQTFTMAAVPSKAKGKESGEAPAKGAKASDEEIQGSF